MNEPLRTDGELLAEFADAGNESAFTELMARHGPMAYGVALRVLADHHEAQDVAQAAFCALARKAHSIRKDASVGGWLHRVAWCLAVDVKSSRASRRRREEATMHAQAEKARDVAGEQGFREELDAALNQLPERYRQPLVLFHIEGHSLDVTARMLGLKSGTVGSQLTRAREMLRAKLVRRGVGVGSVGALTTLLSAEAGVAALPASFVATTAKAAGLAAAGKLAAGVTAGTVSANVAALTKGAVRMILVAKMKTFAAAVVVCALAVGTVAVVAQSQAPASRDKAAGGVGVGVGIDESRFKPESSSAPLNPPKKNPTVPKGERSKQGVPTHQELVGVWKADIQATMALLGLDTAEGLSREVEKTFQAVAEWEKAMEEKAKQMGKVWRPGKKVTKEEIAETLKTSAAQLRDILTNATFEFTSHEMIVKGKEPMTFDLEWVGQDPDTPSIRLRKKSPPGQPWESARLSWRGEALVIKGDRMSNSMVLIPLAGKTSK